MGKHFRLRTVNRDIVALLNEVQEAVASVSEYDKESRMCVKECAVFVDAGVELSRALDKRVFGL